MPRLKSFVTESGFYELAVAAPSMKAALAAWGMTHNAFHQGLARPSDDPTITQATFASPGVVLRRPLGTKGAFKQTPDMPVAPNITGRKKPKKKPDVSAIRLARQALNNATAAHQEQVGALRREREEIDRKIRREDRDWKAQSASLKAAVKDAGKARR